MDHRPNFVYFVARHCEMSVRKRRVVEIDTCTIVGTANQRNLIVSCGRFDHVCIRYEAALYVHRTTATEKCVSPESGCNLLSTTLSFLTDRSRILRYGQCAYLKPYLRSPVPLSTQAPWAMASHKPRRPWDARSTHRRCCRYGSNTHRFNVDKRIRRCHYPRHRCSGRHRYRHASRHAISAGAARLAR